MTPEPSPAPLRYDRGALLADYARAMIGLVLCAGILLFLDPIAWVAWPLMAGLGLFAAFLLQTLAKDRTRIAADADGLQAVVDLGPLSIRNSIQWEDLQTVKLRFYATKRKSREGWMQLTLKDGATTVKLESTLDGFAAIAKTAGTVAGRRDLPLDTPTRENFLEVGVRLIEQT
ncbi:MAG: hypothetical protein QNJ84_05835 [Alphaproteobacteria bacterium]|nr:hypothetical protein [Alphaproteobacteria bacterium]